MAEHILSHPSAAWRITSWDALVTSHLSCFVGRRPGSWGARSSGRKAARSSGRSGAPSPRPRPPGRACASTRSARRESGRFRGARPERDSPRRGATLLRTKGSPRISRPGVLSCADSCCANRAYACCDQRQLVNLGRPSGVYDLICILKSRRAEVLG